MRKILGTTSVTSLNVAEAPHLIADHQLRESYGGWTDEDGAWRTAKGPERKYFPYSDISCFAAGRMDGADHLVWMDGNTLYDNGSDVGTITAGDPMDIVAVDDAFLIFGAAKNYIWDGTHLREQGAWQVDISTDSGVREVVEDTYTVTAITEAASARVTIGAHNFVVGDYAYISGGDMTEIIGRAYYVEAIDTLWIELTCDSQEFTTYTTGATAYRNGSGLAAGNYRFYLTGTVELSDGRILEGKPFSLGPPDEVTGVAWTSTEAKSYNIAAATDGLRLDAIPKWITASVAEFTIDGTIGTDYNPGLRLYRTKMNGYDYYLEKEWSHGDDDFTYTAGATAYYTTDSYTINVPDDELGAVYTPGQYGNNSAPAATTGDISAQRALINSQDNPDRVYWSSLDGIEYFNTNTGWDKLPDTVTAIKGWRRGWVVWSCDRMWFVRILEDGLPDWTEIPTPVGTIYPKAITVVDDGVMFLRPDGLYLYNGSRVEKISRTAFSSITDPESVAAAGDVLYVSGSEKAYVALNRGNGWAWHQAQNFFSMADATNGEVYGCDQFGVYQMFAGWRDGGRLKSKHFGNTAQYRAIRVMLDMKGDTIPTLWVNGNRQSDTDGHDDTTRVTETGRRIERISVPRLNNQYAELAFEMTGDTTVYGYWIEEAR